MKLNKLEILGFKSFPKKTIFEFDSGIVAIVGPNGCGKTNIVEAIKWVLGEQNPYKLRGEKVEDFIFNGSASHNPLNFAEVTVVIENDNTLPISYQEVAITRRYYRSGESEYLLNRVNVRLKDIVSLFLNTGLKAEAYSIFSREMIDHILSSNSKVRRSLFEEAAEIAKYKNRKKIALDNINLIKVDSVRVNDILEEVEKQWRSLKRQVRRAKRYQELKRELKEKRILAANIDHSALTNDFVRVKEKLKTLEETRTELLRTLEENETELEKKQNATKKLNDTISTHKEDINRIQLGKTQITEKVAIIDERKKNIISQKKYLKNENDSLEDKMPQIETLIQKTEDERNTIIKDMGEKEEKGKELIKKIRSLEEKFVVGKNEYENAIRERQEFGSKIKAVKENQISQIADSKNRKESRTTFLSELTELREENRKVEEEIKKLKDEISHKREKESEIRKSLKKERETFTRLEEKNKEKGYEIKEAKDKKNILKNEADFLKNFIKEKKGYNELIRFLNKKFSLFVFPDMLKIQAKKSEALLGVLENFIQTVILSEPERLKEIIEIAEKKKMRAGIFLSFLDNQPLPTPHHNKIRGSLAQFLDVKEGLKNNKNILSFFSRYLLVDTIDDSIDLQSKFKEYTFVTKNGDVLSNGILFTGRGTHRELIGVDNRISKNAQEMEKIEVLLKEKVKEKEIIEKEKKNAAKNLEQLNTNFSAASVALREDEFSYEKRLFEKTTIEKRIRKVQKEIKEVEQSLNELENNMLTNERLFNKDEEVYSTVDENCTAKESAFKEVEERLRSSRNEQNQDEILLTRLKGEARAKEEVLKSAVKELEGINMKKNENNKRIESFEETIISLEKSSKTLKEKQFNIQEELKDIETTLNKHIERGIAADREMEELKTTEKNVTEKEKSIYEEISQLNLEKVRLESQISSISKNIIAEYGVDIASIKEETTILNKERLQEEMDILEERKRKFGPVNLMAEEDLKDTDKRKEELITQKTDLQESQKDLLQTINHIDNVAKERFLDTFMGVRDNFKIVFKKLFETGECDLVLAEGDPLEAEISIIAKPKHKKLERIESLSTGERALVAIALLFSFYLVKPSPICVLDEIDAPLDDANVERFISLLQEFKKRSQLFIITHNKRTMEASDYLYGITMTEPGVSTIASVNIS